MDDTLKQALEEQLAYLEPINQQAIQSFDWATEVVVIGRKFGLLIDDIKDLQHETMMVLVGLLGVEDYENQIITKVALAPTEASKIVEQISERVFSPIHDFILHGGTNTSTVAVINTNTKDTGIEIIQEKPTPVTIDSPLQTTNDTSIPFSPIFEPQILDPVPVPNSNTPTAPINNSTPIPIAPQNPTTIGYPIKFIPESTEIPTIPTTIPIAQIPTHNSPIMSSREKLEQFYQQRKQLIDASIQSMDQQKPMS